jgi:hypothetical protein
MKEMTEEEADALDGYYTKYTIMPDMSRPGYFAGKGLVLGNLPPDVTEYLRQEAAAAGKTQADIAADIIRRHLVKSA